MSRLSTSYAPCKRTQHCWPTTPNTVGCYMLRPFAHPVAFCWMLLRVVAQSLKSVKLFSQQLPTFLLFRDRWSVAQQCWIRLLSSSNIVGATHAHYARFTKTYGLYPSHDALQVPTLLGVVASVCTPLPTRTKHIRTVLAQQCWKLLRSFARSLIIHGSILLVTIPPGAHPRGFVIFSFLEAYSPPPRTRKETIPHHRAPDRPHIHSLLHHFYPYKSETTRFHNFYERFPEFTERRIGDAIM